MLATSGLGQFPERSIERIIPDFGDQLSYRQVMHVVVNVLRWGGLAIGPSDCGYALWALPNHPKGIDSLDLLLDHGSIPIPITFPSVQTMKRLVSFSDLDCRLAAAWPGGLTLVVPACRSKARKHARALHGMDTLGLRISRSRIEQQISSEAESPITSAAIRYPDGSVAQDYEDAEEIILSKATTMELSGVGIVGIVHSGHFPLSVNSTVATVTSERRVSIIRPGYYDRRGLTAFMSRTSVEEYGDPT